MPRSVVLMVFLVLAVGGCSPDSTPTGDTSSDNGQSTQLSQHSPTGEQAESQTPVSEQTESATNSGDSVDQANSNDADAASDEEASLDDYSEDYVEDPIVKDSKLPPIDDSWKRLSEREEIWVDMKNKQVVVGGRVCLRRGPLEMFACPEQLKEHESVVAVNCSAVLVHAGLLAVGAKPGSPVKYEPEYVPVSGTKVKIDVTWLEEGQAKTTDAQNWVQNAATQKPLDTHWVFGGSISEEDPNTGHMLYGGDAGMLICVSNFTIATLDIPIESTDLAGDWLYAAFTDNIPQRGTRVLLTLKPEIGGDETEEAIEARSREFNEKANTELEKDGE